MVVWTPVTRYSPSARAMRAMAAARSGAPHDQLGHAACRRSAAPCSPRRRRSRRAPRPRRARAARVMRPGRRHEALERILGVDPALDRPPAPGHVVLAEGERLAGGDPQLLAGRDRAPSPSRSPDARPAAACSSPGSRTRRVRVDEELHRARVDVADGRGDAGRRPRPCPPQLRRRRPARALLHRASGAGAGSSTRARPGGSRCRARRRAPASRCGAAPRRSARGTRRRRRRPRPPRCGRRGARPPARRPRGRDACPCRRRPWPP